MAKKNGYELTRRWFDFVIQNEAQVSAGHTALYLWIVEIANRIGWQESFQITSTQCMAGMTCKSYNTYKKCFDNLVKWGFIELVVKSTNQYMCNVIAISNFNNAIDTPKENGLSKIDKALDKANETFIKPLNLKKNNTIPSQKSASGKRKKKVQAQKKEKVISDDGQKFALWYNEKMKPEAMKPEQSDFDNWGETYDRLIKRGYTKDQIVAAVRWGRNDNFWRGAFQSPVKLDKKNDDGVRYIDVFLDKANDKKPIGEAPPPKKMKYNPVVGMVPDND